MVTCWDPHFRRGPLWCAITGPRPWYCAVPDMCRSQFMGSGVHENVEKWTPVSNSLSFFSGLNPLGVDGRCTPTCVAPCDVPGCNGIPCAYRTPYATRGLYGQRDCVRHTGSCMACGIPYHHPSEHRVPCMEALPSGHHHVGCTCHRVCSVPSRTLCSYETVQC